MSASQYFLAVDVGTSRTAASTARVTSEGGLVTAPFGLGRSSDSAPSVVFVADGELLFGDAAERRGLAQPERLVREFKRRIGDDVPIVVGEQRFAPEELYARTVAWVVDAVTEREGTRPSAICVTIPVTWGAHRSGLAAAALAREMSSPVELLTEPEAAARHYETTSPLDPGHAIAVYDLGGGTFDAVILRKADDATVRLVGEATGIADFGGADFDDIVLRHVIGAAGLSAAALTADATARVALGSLRRECVEAKEALSFDSEAVVPVLVGQTHTTVRLTRAEFEEMVDDGVERTMDVLGAALDAAGMTSADLDAILLTGGSSRIPRIAQLLSERFDRPIAIDADPKAIVALGAARELADRRAAVARRDDDSLAAGVLLLANDAAAAAAAAIAPAHGLRRRAAAPAHPAQGTPKRGWFGRVPVAAAIAGGTLVLAGGIVVAGATGLGSGIRPEAELPMALATDWLGFSLVNSSSPAQTTEIAAASPATPHSESARSLKAPSKHVKRPSDDTQAPVTRTSNATRTEDSARPSRIPDADTPRPTPTNPPTTTSDDPPPANPPADPTPSDPPADPTPSGPPADPTPSDPPPDPTPSDPPPDPTPSDPPPDPTPSDPPADPTPSDPPADPTPSDPPPDPTPSDPPPADPEPSSPAPDPEPTTIPPPEPEPTP